MESSASGRIFELLETVFPGLGEGVEELRGLGVPWESVSTPFLSFEGERPVSHVGLIELKLLLMGTPTTVGTVHAVATHPEFRGRGHYRLAMEALLRHAETRYETLVLTTLHPEYFQPFGFRVVREHEFLLRPLAAAFPAAGSGPRVRPLRTADPEDAALLHRILESREPVSSVVGVFPEKAIFFFNEARRPLWHSEDLDVILCLERRGARVALYDVVGRSLPGLGAILARLPGPVEELVFHFAPDRFTGAAVPAPRTFDHDGPSYLMVRGRFAAEGEAFTLPRSART